MVRLRKKFKKYVPKPNLYRPKQNGADCANCPLRDQRNAIAAPIPKKASLVVLGEAPSNIDQSRREYFAGPAGDCLKAGLVEAGIPRDAIVVNNCIQCRPKRRLSVTEWKQALKCCWPRLEKELCQTECTMVLALGKWSQYVTRGKTDPIHDWCGSPYPMESPFWKRPKKKKKKKKKKSVSTPTSETTLEKTRLQTDPPDVIVTYHPGMLLGGKRQYLPVFAEHLDRAWKLSTGVLKPWKWCKIYAKDDVEAMRALRKMWRDVKAGKIDRLGIDIETNGANPVVDSMTKIGISSREVAVSLSWPLRQDAVPLVRSILAHPVAKAAHNGTHDLIGFEKEGYEVGGYEYDTIIQHATWVPTLLHRLQFACCTEFHMPAWKKEFKIGGDEKGLERFLKADPLELGIYNAKDAYMTLLLSYALEKRLKEEVENWEFLYTGYLRRSLISKDMRKRGVLIDKKALVKHMKSFRQRRYRAGLELRKHAIECGYGEERSKEFNPNSPIQRKHFFFEHLKARSTKFSAKTGKPSLDSKVLETLVIHPDERIAKAARIYIRFKRWDKLLGFTKKMYKTGAKMVNPDGQCWGTKTGRWAYRDPNLTTIPKPKYRKGKKKNKDGSYPQILLAPGMRDIFVARPGMTMVARDFSQLELRILSYLSQDELLMKWYGEGADIHTENTKQWFATQNPSKSQRGLAKTIVFGMNYGGGAKTIWENLRVSYKGLYLSDVEKFITLWYMQHPNIATFQNHLMLQAEDEDLVRIPHSGKVVQLYGDRDPPKIYNPPVQGTAAFIIDAAIERVWKRLAHEEGETLLLQVHDELIGESPDPDRLDNILKEEMEKPITIHGRSIVFPTEGKRGPNWGNME